jgi:hypothetical protein
MRFVIVFFIFILFVGINIYIRIKTLRYYKLLVERRIEFSFSDLFSSQKWNQIVTHIYPNDKELLNTFRKHILITGTVFILIILIVLSLLYVLRNNL